MRVSVVGAAGYVGGELVRILLGHPALQLAQVTSSSLRGRPLSGTHPNLRGFTDLRYCDPTELAACDAILVAGTHSARAPALSELRRLAPVVVDCGHRLRLRDPDSFRRWYGSEPEPEEVLRAAVYGLPEVSRPQLPGATLIAGVGCSAAATILALLPLARAGWELSAPAVVEALFGSSAAGSRADPSTHHPERAGAVRRFAPSGHRHAAEVAQALEWAPESLSYSGVAVEMVRGVSVAVTCFVSSPLAPAAVWEAFRAAYDAEPFVRIVAQRSGLHRLPDPRWLAGTNLCDVGFALDESGQRLRLFAALDNLGKGAAGSAVQALNCALGIEERSGLNFTGLHPL